MTNPGSNGPKLPIIRPELGQAEIDAVAEVLRSGWVTQGPQVAAFEQELATFLGAPRACAVSSCTTALHLALKAAGVRRDDEVICPSHSFIATANAIRYLDAVPVFVDIDPLTYNLDPEQVSGLVGPKTRAILCVHQIGMPCDLLALRRIADHHGIALVEDAACAIGSEIHIDGSWRRIGEPVGDVACFSFHPRKLLTTGDGGLITTRHAAWDHKFRLWRQHGMSIPDTERHSAAKVLVESYQELGYNYRLTDIQAAIGRQQLRRLPDIVQRRRHLARRYNRLLAAIPGLQPPSEPDWARSNFQSYCLRLPNAKCRDEAAQFLLERGIATRPGIMAIHQEPAYDQEAWSCAAPTGSCTCPARTCLHLAHTETARRDTLLLPLYHQMSDADQDRVVQALEQALALHHSP